MPRAATKTTTNRKRLNLDLSSTAHDQLQKLSEETGKNMAEVLRTGLALYDMAHEANKQGQSMGIIEGDKVVREIVIAL
jgi:hypothetical protein